MGLCGALGGALAGAAVGAFGYGALNAAAAVLLVIPTFLAARPACRR
jgi:hypothetical protein